MGDCNCFIVMLQTPRFHVPFWLSHILVYSIYFTLLWASFCLSWDWSI